MKQDFLQDALALLAEIHVLAKSELSEVEAFLDAPSFDYVGADWPPAYSEALSTRDALRSLIENSALWHPTEEDLRGFGSLSEVLKDLIRFVQRFPQTDNLVRRIEERMSLVAPANAAHGSNQQSSHHVPSGFSAALAREARNDMERVTRLLGEPSGLRSPTGPVVLEPRLDSRKAWNEWSRQLCAASLWAGVSVCSVTTRWAAGLVKPFDLFGDQDPKGFWESIDAWMAGPDRVQWQQVLWYWKEARDLVRAAGGSVSLGDSPEWVFDAASGMLSALAFVVHVGDHLTWREHRAYRGSWDRSLGKMPGDSAWHCVSATCQAEKRKPEMVATEMLADFRNRILD